MSNQKVTILSITLIAVLTIVMGSEYAENVIVAGISGLIGYLAKE